ncbi:MAG: hypothetical protein ACYTFY_11355 [Planctomycetota bacterium]|jgi:hypothetical protein
MKTEVNMCYFNMAGGFWKPDEISGHYRDMLDMGADSVGINFMETGYKFLKPRVELALEEGIRIYPMPGRIAGIFAAGVQPSSMFIAQNWDAVMQREQDNPPFGETVACVNNPKFIDWFYPYMEKVYSFLGGNGIIFDEPKDAYNPCYCPHCCELVDKVTEENMVLLRERSVAQVMGNVCDMIKNINAENTTAVILFSKTSEHFLDQILQLPGMDYIGFNGPLCRQGDEGRKDNFWESNPFLCDTFPPRIPVIRKAGKGVLAFVETFSVQPWSYQVLKDNLAEFIEWDVDMWCFNYYPHRNPDPEGVMDIIRDIVKRIKNK